jgi:hypothetical protein
MKDRETITRRTPRTHDLKSWPESFRATLTGRKRFEVRRDDRSPPFESGDIVRLREFDPGTQDNFTDEDSRLTRVRGYTGRELIGFVGYVDRSAALPQGWCAFDLMSAEDYNRARLAVEGAS